MSHVEDRIRQVLGKAGRLLVPIGSPRDEDDWDQNWLVSRASVLDPAWREVFSPSSIVMVRT